ncbi:MAG: cobalamin-dependent protein [Archangiaceae bacterium]|nr:cobalamin-dependent protein [Archangiaceae bacterium]
MSRVLLVGAGRQEATCGILYLAGFLRRNGVEAYVRLYDADDTEAKVRRSLEGLLKRVRPQVVGISLKWFNHLSRGLMLARVVKAIDPSIRVVVGGNSASYYWRELSAEAHVDDVVLGDGEVPLLGIARGDAEVPNRVTRGQPAAPLQYVQSVASDEVFYSHFDDIFLSGVDRASFSGWVQPGKGCSENCVYCGGTRGMEQASFGRPTSFLRPAKSVRQDHQEIAHRAWQLRYDFAGGSAEFLSRTWEGIDLSRHATTYFLWGVPPPSLIEALAQKFARVYLVLDVGCFSQTQRAELIQRGLLKPCPTDAELMRAVELCRAHPNLKLEVCGIAGLPHTSAACLAEELPLVEQLLERGCDVGSQRLECQPGALVTRHPDRFDMVADATDYAGFVKWFQKRGNISEGEFPMIRFADPKLEVQVQAQFERVHEAVQKSPVELLPRTRLVSGVVSRSTTTLSEWVGSHRAPSKHAAAQVTVLRSADGPGLACAPELKWRDDDVQTGPEAAALLQVLGAFEKAATVGDVEGRLRKTLPEVREVIDALFAGGLLTAAR